MIGVSGIALAYQAPITSQLRDWRLLPEPERLTELHFTDYKTLPKLLAAGSQQAVTFTVHNREHRATVYHYRVTATSEQGAEEDLGKGTFMLHHDDTHRGSTDITVPAGKPSLLIKVELHYKAITPSRTAETIQTQSINFRAAVTDTNAKESAIL